MKNRLSLPHAPALWATMNSLHERIDLISQLTPLTITSHHSLIARNIGQQPAQLSLVTPFSSPASNPPTPSCVQYSNTHARARARARTKTSVGEWKMTDVQAEPERNEEKEIKDKQGKREGAGSAIMTTLYA